MAGGERARIAACLLAAALGAAAVSAEPRTPEAEPRAAWLEALDRGLGEALAPGELSRAHAELGEITHCADCHAGLDATPDAKCAACHEDVAERVRAGIGWHGTFQGDCASCHGEHRGSGADLLGLDRSAFNHDLAAFALRGAHAEVDCGKCHDRAGSDGRRAFHPIGIPHAACASCHENVHGDAFPKGRDCGACHSERGFGAKQLVLAEEAPAPSFDHGADTRFPLLGRHAAVACGDCHDAASRARERTDALAPGRGAARECGSCHRDPHEGALGAACGSCHGAEGWSGAPLRFDHARDTSFSLDASHAGLPCESCHADRRFEARGTRCESCHEDAAALLAGRFRGRPAGAPDPHAGADACRSCHPGEEARPRLVDYERACVGCHPSEYGALLLTRKRLVDGLVVEAEAKLRARELARERGDAAGGEDLAALAAELEALARSGVHNVPLAEAILRGAAREAAR
jgi:hypothetical protein